MRIGQLEHGKAFLFKSSSNPVLVRYAGYVLLDVYYETAIKQKNILIRSYPLLSKGDMCAGPLIKESEVY